MKSRTEKRKTEQEEKRVESMWDREREREEKSR